MSLRSTYLVQRLQPPTDYVNPFNFGGGLPNGGLSSAAMDVLNPIFSFDYMGSAEYEFGDVPKTFGRIADMAKANELAAFKVDVLLSQVPPAFGDKTKPERGAKGTVYVLAHTDLRAEITERVHDMATGKVYSKGDHMLERVLRPRPNSEFPLRTIGGLEMNNDFLYFTDRDAFVKAADLFGVPIGNL